MLLARRFMCLVDDLLRRLFSTSDVLVRFCCIFSVFIEDSLKNDDESDEEHISWPSADCDRDSLSDVVVGVVDEAIELTANDDDDDSMRMLRSSVSEIFFFLSKLE